MRAKISLLFVLCLAMVVVMTGCSNGKGNGKDGGERAKYENMVNVVEPSVKFADLGASDFKAKKITSIEGFNGKLWVGSYNGVHSFDGVEWRLSNRDRYNAIGSNKIINFSVNDNRLWISTDNGACYYTPDNEGGKFISIFTNGKARSCFGSSLGTFVGTANGVVNDGNIINKENNNLMSNEITVVNGKENTILIGTREGLAKYEGGVISTYTGPAKALVGSSLREVPANPPNCKLPSNNIKCILPFGDNQYAIGTTCGLAITNLDNKWDAYRTDYDDYVQNGAQIEKAHLNGNMKLPSNVINCLAKTEGNELLFVGTTYGLAVLDASGNLLDLNQLVDDYPYDSEAVVGLACLNNNLYIAQRDKIDVIKNVKSLVDSVKKG